MRGRFSATYHKEVDSIWYSKHQQFVRHKLSTYNILCGTYESMEDT